MTERSPGPSKQQDSRIAPAAVDDTARAVIDTLSAAGYVAFLNGGCVRDLLMGQAPKDWDIVTDAGPDEVTGLFEHTIPVGAQFGIVRVRIEDREFEVARFRREGPYSDGRRPDHVDLAGPRQDAQRRDFTINGMFYDPRADEVLDFVGGQTDLEAGRIRAIGDPAARFSEDGLRILRAIRFAARLGFEIEAQTWQAVRDHASMLEAVSAERIRDELTRILVEGGAARGWELLFESGLLERILPEVAAMRGVEQSPEHHPEGDVWQHILVMLGQLDALEHPSPTLAWGVLLHDIGKPVTFSVADRIRFHGHDERGAQMVDDIARRLRFSNVDRDRIHMLTAQHMRFRNVRDMRTSKRKRFLRQDGFDELLELHRIDCQSSHGKLDLYDYCRDSIAGDRQEVDEELRPEPLMNGADLIALGLEPGPAFAQILRWVEDEQLDGRLTSREAALTAVKQRWPAADV